ncbi:M48 family metallopeptidase [Glycomyces paridis]|uniref:Peptidase M48 domain-containing protein n=1 Tax=Glycomyces paridis TaxID=2126555 RepID=A0A4S8PQP1_9ACTN|nr:M48 family metallopeptidase [Glycomyces paridis]THV30624.1 hypothetical protein E9998_04345 [Glycomyces paridis]
MRGVYAYTVFAACFVALLPWAFGRRLSFEAPLDLGLYVLAALGALGVLAQTWPLAKAHRAVLRRRPEGTPLSREDAPGLWDLAERTASALGSPMPDSIVVDAHPEFRLWAFTERTRTSFTVTVGLPLLTSLTTGQARALIARLLAATTGWAWRHARTTTGRDLLRLALRHPLLHRRNPLAWPLRGYADLYFELHGATDRAMTFDADMRAAQVAGGAHLQSALRETLATEWAWHSFDHRFLRRWDRARLVPSDVLGGYALYREHHPDEIAALLSLTLDNGNPRSRYPSFRRRFAATDGIEGTAHENDGATALDLLADADRLRARFEDRYTAPGSERVDWGDLGERASLGFHRPVAAAAYQAIAKALPSRPAGLDAVVAEIEAGRRDRLFRSLDRARFPANGFESMLVCAAFASKALRTEIPWAGTMAPKCVDGRPFDTRVLQKPLFSIPPDPARFRLQLKEVGVDIALAALDSGPEGS